MKLDDVNSLLDRADRAGRIKTAIDTAKSQLEVWSQLTPSQIKASDLQIPMGARLPPPISSCTSQKEEFIKWCKSAWDIELSKAIEELEKLK